MEPEPELVEEGLKLIEQASSILESISNNPGVTSKEFYSALDTAGIFCVDTRDALYMAATSIEMSMESLNDLDGLTVH